MFSVDLDCDNIGKVNKDKRTIDVHVREVANFGPKLSQKQSKSGKFSGGSC